MDVDVGVDGLPAGWGSEVLRAYDVFGPPRDVVVLSIDDAYQSLGVGGVPELYAAFEVVDDPYGSAVLDSIVLDDFLTILDGGDELGLRRWLERLHPRDPEGLFREVRGRYRAAQADKDFRSYLRKPYQSQEGQTHFDEYRYQRSPRLKGEREVKNRDIDRLRTEVQNMVDQGATVDEVRERLGLDSRIIRGEARRAARQAEWHHQDEIESLGKRLEETTDPAERAQIQDWLQWHKSRLRRQVHYTPPRAAGMPPPTPIPLPPPLPAYRPMSLRQGHRPGAVVESNRGKGPGQLWTPGPVDREPYIPRRRTPV